MKLNQLVYVDSPFPMIFLFHPNDLAHRNDAPSDWYTYDFACRREFEAGNLVAFHANHDHTYNLRFTSGNLRKKERALQSGSWEWGYTVRHGRVYVDGGLFVPSEEALPMEDAFADQWIDLPNGNYRVTVVAIVPRTDYSLANYIIRFELVRVPLRIAPSPVPPYLEGYKDRLPRMDRGISADDLYEGGMDVSIQASYPLLVVSEKTLLPGTVVTTAVSDTIYRALYASFKQAEKEAVQVGGFQKVYVIAAPSDGASDFATLGWIRVWSRNGGAPSEVYIDVERLVRVLERMEGDPLPTARVELVTRPTALLTMAQVEELKTEFTRYADRYTEGENVITAFDREHVAATTTGAALTTRLLEILPLPIKTRFHLYAASDAERYSALTAMLNAEPEEK